jgi:hypothetical protein
MDTIRQICKSIPLDENHKITYTKPINNDIEGIFAFSYYVPLRAETAKSYIYSEGIKMYLKMIQEHPETWRNWKVVLYTDEISYERVLIHPGSVSNEEHAKRVEEFRSILNNDPNIILAIIRWDEYKKNESGTSIEPIMMRCFRNKAFEDFPEVPVFVRDADTLFEAKFKRGRFETFDYNDLHAWEKEYLEGFSRKKRKYKFCISAHTGYSRYWHQPQKTSDKDVKMIGTFAGLVGSLGGINEWASGDLWDSCIQYMTGRCKIQLSKNEEGSNIYVTQKNIEKDLALDEPILLYIIIPELFHKTFFFILAFGGEPSLDKDRIIPMYRIKKEENIKNIKKLYTMFQTTPDPSSGISGKYKHKGTYALYTGYHTPINVEHMISRAVPEVNTRRQEGYFNTLRKHMKPEDYEKVHKELIKKIDNIDPKYLEMERRARFQNRNIWNTEKNETKKSAVHKTPNNEVHIVVPYLNRPYTRKSYNDVDYIKEVFSKPQYHTFLKKLFELLYKFLKPRMICEVKTRKRKAERNNNGRRKVTRRSNNGNSGNNNSNNNTNMNNSK